MIFSTSFLCFLYYKYIQNILKIIMVLFSKFGRWLGCKDDFGSTTVSPRSTGHPACTEMRWRTLHPSVTLLGALSSHCAWMVGRCLPTASYHLCSPPTQREAPSILAQPKSATTSAPGTDPSWTSRRVTLSRSLTRRGNKAGGEGRSMAGWVRAEFGISGILASVKLYWNYGLEQLGSGSWRPYLVKGWGGHRGFIHWCNLHLLIEHLLRARPAECLGDKNEHSTIPALMKLIV